MRAVDGVTFSLDRGKTLGVVGESGSGKTVLSRSVMGLLPKRRTREGSVLFNGAELDGLDAKAMREYWGSQMAMIFQDPMTSLNPVMKIGKQITESMRHAPRRRRKDYANELRREPAASVRIPEPEQRLKEYPHQLSGGMRQRCASRSRWRAARAAPRRRAHHRARRHGAGAGARPHGAAATRALHGDWCSSPTTSASSRGAPTRSSVMYAGRIVEKAPTARAVPRHEDAVHRGAAVVDPEDRRARATRGSRRSRAGRRTS